MTDPLTVPAQPEEDRPEERQRYTRRSVLIAAKLCEGDRIADCDVTDLSAGGARVTAAEKCACNARMSLLIEDFQFHGHIAWCDGDCLGLQFSDDPEAVAPAIPEILNRTQDGRERRRHTRSTVLWSGELYGGVRRAQCEVLNISAGGAKLHAQGNFPVGTEVSFRSIRFGEFKAEVVWQNKENSTLGIAFLEDPEHTAEILEKSLPSIRKDES